MMPAASSAAMKEKIRQAQDARRQRLRTRLEELSAGGTALPLSPPRGGRGAGAGGGAGAGAGGPAGPSGAEAPPRHVRFPTPDGTGARPDVGGGGGVIAPFGGDGSERWGGLSLDIPSPPMCPPPQWPGDEADRCVWARLAVLTLRASGAARVRRMPWLPSGTCVDTPSRAPCRARSLLGPDSPQTQAARQAWRESILNDPAAYLRASPIAGLAPPPPPLQDSSTPAQPLQRAHVDSVVQQMARPRRAPGESEESGEARARDASPGGALDIDSWVSREGSAASFHAYQDRVRDKMLAVGPTRSCPVLSSGSSALRACYGTHRHTHAHTYARTFVCVSLCACAQIDTPIHATHHSTAQAPTFYTPYTPYTHYTPYTPYKPCTPCTYLGTDMKRCDNVID